MLGFRKKKRTLIGFTTAPSKKGLDLFTSIKEQIMTVGKTGERL